MTTRVEPEDVERARGGDRAALARLLEGVYDSIYRMAWRWCGARADAEDVAQDVCAKLAAAIRSFRGDADIKTWLYRVTYNASIDHIRARRRFAEAEASNVVALFADTHAPAADEALAGAEIWQEVRALPGQQRDAVLLVYGEELSHKEAAALMGCSESTVSWHLHEARKRLKIRLEATGAAR